MSFAKLTVKDLKKFKPRDGVATRPDIVGRIIYGALLNETVIRVRFDDGFYVGEVNPAVIGDGDEMPEQLLKRPEAKALLGVLEGYALCRKQLDSRDLREAIGAIVRDAVCENTALGRKND